MDFDTIREILTNDVDQKLIDLFIESLYEEKKPTVIEILEKWQVYKEKNKVQLPQIEKNTFSIRKDVDEDVFVYCEDDSNDYDPFRISEELAEERKGKFNALNVKSANDLKGEISERLVEFVASELSVRGQSLGYCSDFLECINLEPEEIEKIQDNNQNIIKNLKKEFYETEVYKELVKTIKDKEKKEQSSKWRKVKYEEGSDFPNSFSFGTLTEAYIFFQELNDPEAYICKTRIYTTEKGFEKEETKIEDDEAKEIIKEEEKAWRSWVDEAEKETGIRYQVEPAIGPNMNEKRRTNPGTKPKSIKRI